MRGRRVGNERAMSGRQELVAKDLLVLNQVYHVFDHQELLFIVYL